MRSRPRISIGYKQPGHGPDLLQHCGDQVVILGLPTPGAEIGATPEHIADRIRAALGVVPSERLHLTPDCGMWFLPRAVAFGKTRSLVTAANIPHGELQSESPMTTNADLFPSAVWSPRDE